MSDRKDRPHLGQLVVGCDGSPESNRALERAAALARDLGMQVAAVNVIPAVSFGKPHPAEEREQKEILAEARTKLAELGVEADAVGIVGEPADELIAYARKTVADLIIVGTHGRGTAGRLLLGSVRTQVLHHADRDVLVIR